MNLYEKIFQGIPLKGGKVLEAGCGAGNLSRFLLEREAESVLAVSIDDDHISYCRERVPSEYKNRIKFHRGDLRNLKGVGSSTFDLVTAGFLVGVINPFDFDKIIAEFHRLIKPGGHVMITDYEPFDGYSDETSRLHRRLWNMENALSVLISGEKSYYEYPPEWIKDRLNKAGFIGIKVETPIDKVLWKKELIEEHAEGIRQMVEKAPAAFKKGFLKELDGLMREAEGVDIYSGRIFSITAQKKAASKAAHNNETSEGKFTENGTLFF